jgi:uncharacterized protein (DUF885 family)
MKKKATHDAGVWRLPEGEAYYAASLVTWTTTSKKPAEIHQLGLELVKDHAARIDTLMRKLGMTQGTVGERLRAMYKDPQYQFANTDAAKEALLANLNTRVQRVRAKLPNYFATLPKANVEIKRVPKEIEAGAPGAITTSPRSTVSDRVSTGSTCAIPLSSPSGRCRPSLTTRAFQDTICSCPSRRKRTCP